VSGDATNAPSPVAGPEARGHAGRRRLSSYLGHAARLALGAVFLLAGTLKIVDVAEFARATASYGLVGARLAAVAAPIMIAIEIALAVALLTGYRTRIAAALTGLLLVAFIALEGWGIAQGRTESCGCFGAYVQRTPVEVILEDLGFLALAVMVIVFLGSWVARRRAIAAGAVLSAAVAALALSIASPRLPIDPWVTRLAVGRSVDDLGLGARLPPDVQASGVQGSRRCAQRAVGGPGTPQGRRAHPLERGGPRRVPVGGLPGVRGPHGRRASAQAAVSAPAALFPAAVGTGRGDLQGPSPAGGRPAIIGGLMTARIGVAHLILAATAAALTIATAEPAVAAEVVCRANYDFCVEVDGVYPQDARFFVSDTRGKFLVDIPSKSKSVLIDLPTRRAVSVPRTSIKPDGADGVIRVADPGLAASPAYALSIEGPVLRFQADTARPWSPTAPSIARG
jgi:uncharacterized membrane protein YphA (DoxX/SURF4 family)